MSVDTSQLPANVQELINRAVADAIAATKPAPPRELTPAEKAASFLAQAEAAERGDRTTPSGSVATHAALIAVLHVLLEAVFPPAREQPQAQEQSQETGQSATEHESGV